MELKDTIELMQSDDYKERFKAEYLQLTIRLEKLRHFYDNYENLDFTPTCPKGLLLSQSSSMQGYLMFLVKRAEIEGIDLSYVEYGVDVI